MVVIIFIWLSYADFNYAGHVTSNSKDEVSKLEILKDGFIVTLKEAGDLLKGFKEKINQTNTFEIQAPQQSGNADLKDSPQVASTSLLRIGSVIASTTQTDQLIKNTASTTTTN